MLSLWIAFATVNNKIVIILLSSKKIVWYLIDLLTDTATILNEFDLRSIIGCPGSMSTFRLYFRALFGTFFVKVFLE